MAQRLTLLLSLFSLALTAQFASPISWTFGQKALEDDRFELTATATAEPGWAVYSQFTDEGGPVPTTFYWTEGDHYELVGKSKENGHRKEGMDDLFGVNVIKFLSDTPVTFSQVVRVIDYDKSIQGEVEYMCCDDTQCLPPTTEPFTYVVARSSEDKLPVTNRASEDKKSGTGQHTDPEITGSAGTSGEVAAPASAPETALTDLPREEVMAAYSATMPPPTEMAPVSWKVTVESLEGSRYRISMTGTILPRWKVYGMHVDPEIGPIPTELVIDENFGNALEAGVTERTTTLKTAFDPTWEAEVSVIDGGTVTYSQVIKVNDPGEITGYLYFQTCDDEVCLPPEEVPFSFDPETAAITIADFGVGAIDDTEALTGTKVTQQTDFDADPLGSCSEGERSTAGGSLWKVFGLGILGGLFALIMPCIFPMIPLTVSYFTKGKGGVGRAALYGLFIFLIYVLLSLPFHLVAGIDPGILNSIASNVWLNLLFFAVFILFAGSFFGFYELTLPQRWTNKSSEAEGAGGVLGIFFMALTLALVSFSCTGPILGSLLVEAVSDGAWPLTAGMAGFGVALGLPFALFAAFPGVLNSMPKSGGWLNSVKVVLGFVEVALAFKFLSNADLVGNWDLLRIEPFLAIWMLCSLGIAAYLFGWISFPGDSRNRKAGPLALAVAIAGVAFSAYLAFGFTQDRDTGTFRSLDLLSGIAPPVGYSYFRPSDCPQGITCFKDLEAGLAYAREVNKPVMLDFTGYTCVNCRKMEEHVWSQDRIKDILTNDYVLISLYVDDRGELPADQVREVERLDGTGRVQTIDQVGEKWHYFQQRVFKHATQPYYVLVSPDGRTLNPPVAYTPDAEDYETFLRCGLATFSTLRGK